MHTQSTKRMAHSQLNFAAWPESAAYRSSYGTVRQTHQESSRGSRKSSCPWNCIPAIFLFDFLELYLSLQTFLSVRWQSVMTAEFYWYVCEGQIIVPYYPWMKVWELKNNTLTRTRTAHRCKIIIFIVKTAVAQASVCIYFASSVMVIVIGSEEKK